MGTGKNDYEPKNPIVAAAGNCVRSFMSFWKVGKDEAPPKANSIVPKARKKLNTEGAGYSAISGSLSAIKRDTNNKMIAINVVTRANMAAGLHKRKERKRKNIY